MIFCTIRNYHDVEPRVKRAPAATTAIRYRLRHDQGAATRSSTPTTCRGSTHTADRGQAGLLAEVTYDPWPHPYLVLDTGYSLAPYNHFELGSPLLIDYVWGRQVGELTVNP
jgi:phospholipid/cholesterol/gamma-HCH transport system substrate-binding protein